MSDPTVDSVFATYNDFEICNSWHKVFASKSLHDNDEWPASSVVSLVWGLTGLWGVDGMRAVLDCGSDKLDAFHRYLDLIGEHWAARWLRSTLDSIGRSNLLSERYILSAEFESLAKKLDQEWDCYHQDVSTSLAAFARIHRHETSPFISEIAETAKADRNERDAQIRRGIETAGDGTL